MNIQNALLTANARHGLFERGSVLVVGVSGGADSLALLHALAVLRRRLSLTLVAATLDHGWRGPAGAADVAHVMALAEHWRVSCVAGSVPPAYWAARDGAGLEAAAREVRYAFLAATAREQGAAVIAVAHHADDQAETVLLHLLRGAGLGGLAGMRPVSPLPGFAGLRLIRPLLSVTHADILAYCAAHQIEARDDATNADTAFTRAWLRHEVLPQLETRFPGAARALTGLAENTARDSALLDELTAQVMHSARIEAASVSLPRAVFAQLPAALQYRFVRRAVAHFAPDAELPHERTAAAVDFWLRGRPGQLIELPGGLRAHLTAAQVTIFKPDSP